MSEQPIRNSVSDNNGALLDKIENAYKIYRISELYLKDVWDDYGKMKIARLRLDFARHQLDTLLKEARDCGIEHTELESIRRRFSQDM